MATEDAPAKLQYNEKDPASWSDRCNTIYELKREVPAISGESLAVVLETGGIVPMDIETYGVKCGHSRADHLVDVRAVTNVHAVSNCNYETCPCKGWS